MKLPLAHAPLGRPIPPSQVPAKAAASAPRARVAERQAFPVVWPEVIWRRSSVSESDFDRSFREGIQYGPPPRVIRERRYAFVVDESFEPRTTHFEMHSPGGL